MLIGSQMYVASGILFLLPCLLLFFAWRGLSQRGSARTLPAWRSYLIRTALLLAGVSTLLNIVWNVSWLHSGGSPHGMGAGPGIWQSLGPALACTLLLATVMSLFGNGRVRILLVFWSLSMFFVFQAIYILQFD